MNIYHCLASRYCNWKIGSMCPYSASLVLAAVFSPMNRLTQLHINMMKDILNSFEELCSCLTQLLACFIFCITPILSFTDLSPLSLHVYCNHHYWCIIIWTRSMKKLRIWLHQALKVWASKADSSACLFRQWRCSDSAFTEVFRTPRDYCAPKHGSCRFLACPGLTSEQVRQRRDHKAQLRNQSPWKADVSIKSRIWRLTRSDASIRTQYWRGSHWHTCASQLCWSAWEWSECINNTMESNVTCLLYTAYWYPYGRRGTVV